LSQEKEIFSFDLPDVPEFQVDLIDPVAKTIDASVPYLAGMLTTLGQQVTEFTISEFAKLYWGKQYPYTANNNELHWAYRITSGANITDGTTSPPYPWGAVGSVPLIYDDVPSGPPINNEPVTADGIQRWFTIEAENHSTDFWVLNITERDARTGCDLLFLLKFALIQ
jgi:hypothetical protein